VIGAMVASGKPRSSHAAQLQASHLHEIAADFLREGAGGERWVWIMT
jgi:hypothetical protein